jgi:thiol-disulfide isomerase/thioredoxin
MLARWWMKFGWAAALWIFAAGATVASFAQSATPLPPQAETLQAKPALPVPQTAPVAPDDNFVPLARPGEIYLQAMKPLDTVRSSLDNWSDAELGALASGIRMAREACGEISIKMSGEQDLYDLIRLCSLGQDWTKANSAAVQYISIGASSHRAQAYALSISALVHLTDLDGAVTQARAMLRDMPYNGEVAYSMQFLKTYLTQAVDPNALGFATEEHGALVEALASGTTLQSLHGEAVMGAGALFESGMQLAFLQRYAGDTRGAERTCADLDAAVAKVDTLSVPDRQLIAAVRKEYGLLGYVLPEIDAQGIAGSHAAKKFRNDDGFVTIVEVFPDYCPQCAKMMSGLEEFAAEHVAAKVHARGLVIRDDMTAAAPESWKGLKSATTLAVKPDAVSMLGATEYPLLVVTDQHGIVYFVGTIPANAFVPNGYMEQVIGRIVGERAVVRNGPRNGTVNGSRNGGHNDPRARATPAVKKP